MAEEGGVNDPFAFDRERELASQAADRRLMDAKLAIDEMLARLRLELIRLYGEEDALEFFRTVGLLDESREES